MIEEWDTVADGPEPPHICPRCGTIGAPPDLPDWGKAQVGLAEQVWSGMGREIDHLETLLAILRDAYARNDPQALADAFGYVERQANGAE